MDGGSWTAARGRRLVDGGTALATATPTATGWLAFAAGTGITLAEPAPATAELRPGRESSRE
ncbi:hypothetical protein [Streptomyces sp. NBC_00878]|uniref:hypothetical protein n=1 Tax=Streptomyces sp. NBC_00878 TaxID=2975854 RepID=UPI002254B4D4|nr:hypothetical protein [Streptomyces sp. NBC_00878]MCX4904277.1 hypothetical protein [Streptomyces sp. NBC_00878]